MRLWVSSLLLAACAPVNAEVETDLTVLDDWVPPTQDQRLEEVLFVVTSEPVPGGQWRLAVVEPEPVDGQGTLIELIEPPGAHAREEFTYATMVAAGPDLIITERVSSGSVPSQVVRFDTASRTFETLATGDPASNLITIEATGQVMRLPSFSQVQVVPVGSPPTHLVVGTSPGSRADCPDLPAPSIDVLSLTEPERIRHYYPEEDWNIPGRWQMLSIAAPARADALMLDLSSTVCENPGARRVVRWSEDGDSSYVGEVQFPVADLQSEVLLGRVHRFVGRDRRSMVGWVADGTTHTVELERGDTHMPLQILDADARDGLVLAAYERESGGVMRMGLTRVRGEGAAWTMFDIPGLPLSWEHDSFPGQSAAIVEVPEGVY